MYRNLFDNAALFCASQRIALAGSQCVAGRSNALLRDA